MVLLYAVYVKSIKQGKIMNEKLATLQNTYLLSRSSKDLSNLYTTLKAFIYSITKIVIYRKNKYFDIEEIVEDLITNIITKYLQKEDFKIDNFFSYIYKSINNSLYDKMFKTKKNVNIEDFIEFLPANEDLEELYLKKERKNEINTYINYIIDFYTQNCSEEVKEEIRFHFEKVKNRGKNIESYLYQIKTKEVKEIFIDVMAEIKLYLRSCIFNSTVEKEK